MNNKIIIQSRIGSKRFPGKSVAKIDGTPILQHLLNGLINFFDPKSVYVVTSDKKENLPIVEISKRSGVNVLMGDEENVASRFLEVLSRDLNTDYFFRICGDSPFFIPEIINESFGLVSQDRTLDIVTSKPNKGYPQGQNIELIKASVFLENYKFFHDKSHFEHVTQYLYENLRNFNYRFIQTDFEHYIYENFKFSVDYPTDLERMKLIYSSMDKKPYNYTLEEMMNLYLTSNIK